MAERDSRQFALVGKRLLHRLRYGIEDLDRLRLDVIIQWLQQSGYARRVELIDHEGQVNRTFF
jgi:hypothetical protein